MSCASRRPPAPLPVALASVLADPRDRALGRDRLLEDLLQSGLDITGRQAAQEATDHQRLERVRARYALAKHLALEPQLARIAHTRTLQPHRPSRRLHRLWFVPVAVTDRLLGALVPPAAKELGDLSLQCLLQDQPCSQPTDRLDRVLLAGHTGQHLIQF